MCSVFIFHNAGHEEFIKLIPLNLYNVCSVSGRGGLSSYTVGLFSAVGGYHENCGGYLEYRGGCSVLLVEKSVVI